VQTMDTHNKLCMINLKLPFRIVSKSQTWSPHYPGITESAKGPHYTVIYFTRSTVRCVRSRVEFDRSGGLAGVPCISKANTQTRVCLCPGQGPGQTRDPGVSGTRYTLNSGISGLSAAHVASHVV
jgi:hypothetical protein